MTENGEKTRIRYDEGCLAVHALNVVGDRWSLLIVRELMYQPRRFQALRGGLPGITAGVLSQRLTQLVASGVVAHDAGLGIYDLTGSGRELLPVLQAMCRWGARHPGHDPRRFISPTALMISMTAMIVTGRALAAGAPLRAGFRSGRDGFVQELGPDGNVHVTATPQIDAPFVLEGGGNALARAVYGPEPVAALAAGGIILLHGDARAAQEYLDLFSLG